MKAGKSGAAAVAPAVQPPRALWNLRTLTTLLIMCVLVWPWPRPQRALPVLKHALQRKRAHKSVRKQSEERRLVLRVLRILANCACTRGSTRSFSV